MDNVFYYALLLHLYHEWYYEDESWDTDDVISSSDETFSSFSSD